MAHREHIKELVLQGMRERRAPSDVKSTIEVELMVDVIEAILAGRLEPAVVANA